MKHYGIPEKIIRIIQNTYDGASCRVVHRGQLSEPFEVLTGGRQGCLLTPILFLLIIDWVMRTTIGAQKTGIQWGLWKQLEDLDFADDLSLLAESQRQMQGKTHKLEEVSSQVGLRINKEKTRVMRIKTDNDRPVSLASGPVEEVEEFVYLGSIVSKNGGTDEDIKRRLTLARSSLRMMDKVWKSKIYSRSTKLRIFKSNILSVLLYGSETWRYTKALHNKVQVFVNKGLRRILNIRWWEKVENEDLWRRANAESVECIIRRKRWNWIGHTLRKSDECIAKQALRWNPQGQRKVGRPRNTWRKEVEKDMTQQGWNWSEVRRRAQDREGWKQLVCGLCSTEGIYSRK